MVSPTLAPFHPALLARPEPPPRKPAREEPLWIVNGTVTLYSACVLELYNHAVEDAIYQRCENCGRLFVRQEGRAEHGQHRRRGVKFCSPNCKAASLQRRYRTRKKQRGEEEG
jgi:hypothetical protein